MLSSRLSTAILAATARWFWTRSSAAIMLGETRRGIRRPGAHHALVLARVEQVPEGHVVGDAEFLQIVEDREFGRAE